ncbi:TetR family transcriptional regulator [Candidatus Uabimicrobium sp. HlEnr_7]|uniref:TetR family transcriptional regulator n=1 Tax=Candidatus Uabimicrobium helgolandensis TaxID=3095367 RepID=UPI003557B738
MVICQFIFDMKNQRARSKDEKQQRKEEILSSALDLLLKNGVVASAAQIAAASKIAKGTIYLYFTSKEEIYLTLFQKQWDPLFLQINKAISTPDLPIKEITATIAEYVVTNTFFLPLMIACSGMLGRSKDKEVIRSYQKILSKNLEESSQLLYKRFEIPPNKGINLFLRTYALVFGMWDVIHMPTIVKEVFREEQWTDFPKNYQQELQETLEMLWHSMLHT